MILKKNYTSLDETLAYLKIQVLDSLNFASRTCPKMEDPRDLFRWLKKRVRYQNDPKGIELLQTMQTLFKRGGLGDCDCFVITTLACCIVNDWDGLNIVLVGRSKVAPVHIYVSIDWNGERKVFDLTNRDFNHERDGYKYVQQLPVNWRNWVPIK